MPAKRKTPRQKLLVKDSSAFLLFALLLVAALFLLIAFGPFKADNFGLLGKKQETQQSEAAGIAPSFKPLIVTGRGSCDSRGTRNYYIGFITLLPTDITYSKQIIFSYKKFSDTNWTERVVDWKGDAYTTADFYAAGGPTIYNFRYAVIESKANPGGTTTPFSDKISVAVTCNTSGLSYCLPFGDVNQNGYRDSADANLVLRYVSKIPPAPTPDQAHAADVTRDGKIDSVDSLKILRDIAGIEPYCGKKGVL